MASLQQRRQDIGHLKFSTSFGRHALAALRRLLKNFPELQPLAVAKLLKALVDKEGPQLVILGKQAIDDDANQTGQMLAALADLTQATFASKVEVSGTDAVGVLRSR